MTACPNQSSEVEFYILAFSASPAGQFSIFFGVFCMYLMTVLGNATIIILIYLVSELHTPMYFFLFNLSLLDVASTSSFIPKLLMITLTQDHKISFHGCITQLFLNLLCIGSENLIQTAMAYDRYLAICVPLQYYQIMSKNRCDSMAACCWLIASLNALMLSSLISVLKFCRSQDIDNFFCDLNSMISLSSSDTKSRKFLILVEDVVLGFVPCLIIVTSYGFIISSILKIQSGDGRLKAFTTCISHLITVILFYGPSIFLHLKQQSVHTKEQDKILSLLYIVVVPMLNPLVYSLRNKDIWKAFLKVKFAARKFFNSLLSPHFCLGHKLDCLQKV